MSEPRLQKRSFLELDVAIPVDALRAEVASLPASAWRPTWWANVHGSVAIVLLRGGSEGTADDFITDAVADQPVLATLPGIAQLIGSEGPFGGCTYGFLFRMAPHGVAHLHVDGHPVWHRHHRVHVPITTHPDAVLVADGRACHLEPGRAWTFDNQSQHGFANGGGERVHLIVDVPDGPALRRLLDGGRHHPGVVDEAAVRRIAHAR